MKSLLRRSSNLTIPQSWRFTLKLVSCLLKLRPLCLMFGCLSECFFTVFTVCNVVQPSRSETCHTLCKHACLRRSSEHRKSEFPLVVFLPVTPTVMLNEKSECRSPSVFAGLQDTYIHCRNFNHQVPSFTSSLCGSWN